LAGSISINWSRICTEPGRRDGVTEVSRVFVDVGTCPVQIHARYAGVAFLGSWRQRSSTCCAGLRMASAAAYFPICPSLCPIRDSNCALNPVFGCFARGRWHPLRASRLFSHTAMACWKSAFVVDVARTYRRSRDHLTHRHPPESAQCASRCRWPDCPRPKPDPWLMRRDSSSLAAQHSMLRQARPASTGSPDPRPGRRQPVEHRVAR